MSPRHEPEPQSQDPRSHAGVRSGQDKARNVEGARHHPESQADPHPAHNPQEKPALPPRHDTHSHAHGDELPTHTNPPGPLKPSKKMTKNGRA